MIHYSLAQVTVQTSMKPHESHVIFFFFSKNRKHNIKSVNQYTYCSLLCVIIYV